VKLLKVYVVIVFMPLEPTKVCTFLRCPSPYNHSSDVTVQYLIMYQSLDTFLSVKNVILSLHNPQPVYHHYYNQVFYEIHLRVSISYLLDLLYNQQHLDSG